VLKRTAKDALQKHGCRATSTETNRRENQERKGVKAYQLSLFKSKQGFLKILMDLHTSLTAEAHLAEGGRQGD
jgi:hypothetical protein